VPNETVTISITDQDAAALDGVLVRVYSALDVFQQEGTTGAVTTGQIQFVMNGELAGVTYRLRFLQVGTSIVSPQDISVTSPANPTNTFAVVAQTHTLSTATDPDLCRISGDIVDGGGNLLEGVHLFFRNRLEPPDPQLLGSSLTTRRAVLGEKVTIITDSAGHVQFDLIRDAEYDVILAGQEDSLGYIVVPDAASALLANLLYPVVSNIVYLPVSPLALSVDDVQAVTLTFTYSSGVTRYDGVPPVTYVSDDVLVATATLEGSDQSDAVLTVTALAVGTAILTPTRTFSEGDEIIARPALAALPTLTVNVT
jgi:hypothetical protein